MDMNLLPIATELLKLSGLAYVLAGGAVAWAVWMAGR